MGLSSQLAPSAIAKPGVIANAAARPASPYDGQAVYQQDIDGLLIWNGSAWYPPGNMPWGIVATTSGGTSGKGYVTGLAQQTVNAGAGITDITSSSMTFTGISGRLYRYRCVGYAASTSASGIAAVTINDGSNNQLQAFYINITNTSGGSTLVADYAFTASGSTTLKMRLNSITGNTTIFATSGSLGWITLEDIGPA